MKYKCPVEECGKSFQTKLARDGHVRMSNDIQHITYRQKLITNVNNQIPQEQSPISPVLKAEPVYSPRVIAKAKELVKEEEILIEEGKKLVKEKEKKEIITEYHNNTIKPKFQNSEWYTNDQVDAIKQAHEVEIKNLKACHKKELIDQEAMYERKNKEIRDQQGNIRLQEHINTKNAWGKIPCRYCGRPIPVEVAAQFGIPCPECHWNMFH